MSATGYTPISLYYSSTASAVPLAANLVSGELALNITDGRLYYKDNAGAVQLLSTSTTATGTANGVLYLNGSKVATSGSALTFDGSNLGVQSTVTSNAVTTATLTATAVSYVNDGTINYRVIPVAGVAYTGTISNHPVAFQVNNGEAMRLTSTGLGIGTSSPGVKLEVNGAIRSNAQVRVQLNGSNSIAAGAYMAVLDTAGTYGAITQLDASNNLSFWLNPAGSWTRYMTLDTSGNLGLGVTPSAWGGSYKGFQVAATGVFASNGVNGTTLAHNAYYDGTNDKYLTTGAASRVFQFNGGIRFDLAASGTAGNAITFTQAMTLDASGNLGVGTTSPAGRFDSTSASIQAYLSNATATSTSTGTVYSTIAFRSLKGAGAGSFAYDDAWIQTQRANISYNGDSYTHDSSLVFFTNSSNRDGNPTERARIDSSGNLLVGQTTTINSERLGATSTGNVFLIKNTQNLGTARLVYQNGAGTIDYFYNYAGSTELGTITNTTNSVAYNTSSDYRLKNIDGPLTGSGAFIDALKPKVGTWKADGSKFVGFLAHEVQEVSPGSVVGQKDAVDEDGKPIMQAMEYGSAEFIANIIAELQSLRARVAQLEAKGA